MTDKQGVCSHKVPPPKGPVWLNSLLCDLRIIIITPRPPPPTHSLPLILSQERRQTIISGRRQFPKRHGEPASRSGEDAASPRGPERYCSEGLLWEQAMEMTPESSLDLDILFNTRALRFIPQWALQMTQPGDLCPGGSSSPSNAPFSSPRLRPRQQAHVHLVLQPLLHS